VKGQVFITSEMTYLWSI